MSVLNQSYPHFVVRIQDNASGDDTSDVARALMRSDPRVRYYVHPTNIGGFNNVTHGIIQVETPYFTILSDDDLLMPTFFELALEVHASNGALAFVSTEIATAGDAGVFARSAAAAAGEWFAPPAGVARCLTNGASLPGVVYRTAAMASVGPPSSAWWNWTESGWHALAALRFPIAFTSEIGAIVQLHDGNTSRLMTAREFRISWFRMLVDLRQAAVAEGVSQAWWAEVILPLAWRRFIATTLRLATSADAEGRRTLRTLALAAGLRPAVVTTILAAAQGVAATGVGGVVNAGCDRLLSQHVRTGLGRRATGDDLEAASRALQVLNREAGVDVSGSSGGRVS